jgi:hypothetical protein
MAAAVSARDGTLEVGRVHKLSGLVSSSYDMTADDQKFVVMQEGAAVPVPLTLVQNWTALLER